MKPRVESARLLLSGERCWRQWRRRRRLQRRYRRSAAAAAGGPAAGGPAAARPAAGRARLGSSSLAASCLAGGAFLNALLRSDAFGGGRKPSQPARGGDGVGGVTGAADAAIAQPYFDFVLTLSGADEADDMGAAAATRGFAPARAFSLSVRGSSGGSAGSAAYFVESTDEALALLEALGELPV